MPVPLKVFHQKQGKTGNHGDHRDILCGLKIRTGRGHNQQHCIFSIEQVATRSFYKGREQFADTSTENKIKKREKQFRGHRGD